MQFIVITEQLQITLYALLLGVCFGAAYDLLRILRMLVGITPVPAKRISFAARLPRRHIGRIGKGRISELFFVHLPDVLYGLLTGAIFCIFLYAANNGRFRWYLLMGCAVGFFCYYYSVGRLVVFLSGYITSFLRSILGFLLYLCTQPFLWLWRWLRKLFTPLHKRIVRRQKIRRTEKERKKLAAAVRFT